jgi:rubrerythrin
MKTSKQWWNEVKADDAKFSDWLIKQYRGEVTAASRILAIIDQFDVTERARKVLTRIAGQESTHASWILSLLEARGITPSVEGAEERYWKQVMPAAVDFETTAAVGAHAEKMRLERIQVICDDESAPTDVRTTFKQILRQELFHERAFRKLAGPDAMAKTKYDHEQGRALLGLVP